MVEIASIYVAKVTAKRVYKVIMEILNMGGYAAFVWLSLFVFALGLTFFLYKHSVKQLVKAEKTAKDLGLVEEKSKEIVLDQKQSA